MIKRIKCYIDHNAYRVLYGPCFKFHKALYSTNNSIMQYKARQDITVLFAEGLDHLALAAVIPCHQDSLAYDIGDIGKHGTLCYDHSSEQLVQSGYKTNECPLLKMTVSELL